MLIHGNLADYNPCSSQQIFVLVDDETGRASIRHHTLYLAFTSLQRLDPNIDVDELSSTLVLMVDLDRVDKLTSFCLFQGGGKRSDVPRSRNRLDILQKTGSYYPLDMIWPILFSIACGFRTVSGGTFIGGEQTSFSTPVLLIDNIAALSDNIVTVVEEYKGKPQGGTWACLPVHATTSLFGGTLFDAVADAVQLPTEVVREVLAATVTVAVDTAVTALKGGANSVDFVVPPFGILEFTRNALKQPAISVTFETATELQFEANAALRTGVWSLKSLMSKFKRLSTKRQSSMNTRVHNRKKALAKEETVSGDE